MHSPQDEEYLRASLGAQSSTIHLLMQGAQGSIPDPGKPHMLGAAQAHAPTKPVLRTQEPQLLSLRAVTTEA